MAEATVRTATGRAEIHPLRLATASCTSGTFCPSGVCVRRTTAHAAHTPAAVRMGNHTGDPSELKRLSGQTTNTVKQRSMSR
jgi:hypothetical protein